jgi:multimeric flavodoxin WrbA
MNRITAIVGTHHNGGVINAAVDELLGEAAAAGAETTKFYLVPRTQQWLPCRSWNSVSHSLMFPKPKRAYNSVGQEYLGRQSIRFFGFVTRG